MKYGIIVVVVGALLAGLLGWWLSQNWGSLSKSIPLTTEKIKIQADLEDGTLITLTSLNSVEEILGTVESKTKPENIRLKLVNTMPETISETFASLQGSTFGEDGVGAACGFPNMENESVVSLKMFLTTQQMVDKVGLEKFETDINELFKYCLVYSALGTSLKPKDISVTANQYSKQLTAKYINISL